MSQNPMWRILDDHAWIRILSSRVQLDISLVRASIFQNSLSENHTNISDHFPKMSEDYRRLPIISEQSSNMFRSYRNKFSFDQQLSKLDSTYDIIDISHVKISNFSSHVKIPCFHRNRNPCN